MTTQKGDVLLCQTNDNGDINIENGIVEMSCGLETAAYLSLFGGNFEDANISTLNKVPMTWWGNVEEIELSKQYRSQAQHLLQSIPLTTGNLLRIEEACKKDLQWFLDDKVASSVDVSASIIGLNKISISITIEAKGEESSFEFVENWRSSN